MSQIYTPFVRAAIKLTKFFGLHGGEKTEFSRRIKSFAGYDYFTNSKFTGKKTGKLTDDFIPDDIIHIEKRPGETFRILNLADIHLSDYDYRLIYGFNAFRKIRRLVRHTKPDLITMTGDQVCDDGTLFSVNYLVRQMKKTGIPWAPVFGNHDDEGNCDKNYLADVMMQDENCLFRKGSDAMGCGNYVLSIEENGKPVERIIMMDSAHGLPSPEAQAWALKGIENSSCECSVMSHIPLPEFALAYKEAFDEKAEVYRDGYNAKGVCGEKICCSRENGEAKPSEFFRGLVSTGKVGHILCGHDHLNDFSLDYKSLRLTYLLKTGRGSGNTSGMNGASLITVGGKGIESITHITASFLIPEVIQKTEFSPKG